MNNYYVYVYYRLDTNEPFYVGMGHGDRWKRTNKTARGYNKHFMNIINKIPIAVVIEKENLTQEQAFGIECWLINELVFEYGFSIDIKNSTSNNHYCHLVNMTWGGEGGCGKDMSGENNPMYGKDWREGKTEEELKEIKERLSKSRKGRKISEEQKEKMRGSNNPNSIKVVCLNTGEIFNCISEASKRYKCDCSSLVKCCKEKYSYCGESNGVKLVWRYYENYLSMTKDDIKQAIEKAKNVNKGENNYWYGKRLKGKDNFNSKSVICLTTKKIFYSIREGSEYYKIDNSGLAKCCKGKSGSCGKLPDGTPLVWKYLVWKHNKKFRFKNK